MEQLVNGSRDCFGNQLTVHYPVQRVNNKYGLYRPVELMILGKTDRNETGYNIQKMRQDMKIENEAGYNVQKKMRQDIIYRK